MPYAFPCVNHSSGCRFSPDPRSRFGWFVQRRLIDMNRRSLTLMALLSISTARWLLPLLVGCGAPTDAPTDALRTPWGEPDLQGIWTDPHQTPLQRSAKYGTREFLTEEEVAGINKQRAEMPGRP